MELWKSIPNYEGLYEASTEGRIRTAEGKTTRSARFEKRVWKQRIMKTKKSIRKGGKNCDLHVSLWKDGVEKTWLVARLVALAWCDGYTDGMTVNHKDGNPLNNNIENLEWVTLADNIRHGFDNGLFSSQKECILIADNGERIPFKSLSKASAFLGRNNGYISLCIQHGRKAKTPQGYAYDVVIGVTRNAE